MKEFLVHLKENGIGIVGRRLFDWLAAMHVTVAGTKVVIPAEEVQQIWTATGNVFGDILISIIMALVARYLSFKKDS